MDRLDRIYKIDHLLKSRTVVPFRDMQEELEVSPATVKRDLEHMRNQFNAPIEWDRLKGGYRLGKESKYGPRYELPGLWFNASEAHALLTMQHLLSNIEPGILAERIKSLQDRLYAILGSTDHSVSEIQNRIRILYMGSRKASVKHFEVVASALLNRRRLHLKYLVRSRNEVTERDVSPQRLVHYRDNWYLDAWCHLRNGVHTFSLDAIREAVLLGTSARKVSDLELDEILGSGYGIFSGKQTTMATLRFTPQRARWIVSEVWHPQQQGRLEEKGSYVLQFPYSDDRELIGDVLRFGPDVEVLDPPSLRNRVAKQLRVAAAQYSQQQ